MITPCLLAKICKTSYEHKTFSNHGVEVLIRNIEDATVIAIRGTEISDEDNFWKKMKGTDFKDIARDLTAFSWYMEGLVGSAGMLWPGL